MYVERLWCRPMQAHTYTLVTMSPYGPCLVDSVSHALLVSSVPFDSDNILPPLLSSKGRNPVESSSLDSLSTLCLAVHVCTCSPPAARGRLSNDNWTRDHPSNTAEYHEESLHFVDFFSIPIWFNPRSLAIHSLGTDHLNSVGHGLVFVVLASN